MLLLVNADDGWHGAGSALAVKRNERKPARCGFDCSEKNFEESVIGIWNQYDLELCRGQIPRPEQRKYAGGMRDESENGEWMD